MLPSSIFSLRRGCVIKTFFYSNLFLQILLLQLFPLISHLIACQIACQSQENLKRIQEIVQKVYHDQALPQNFLTDIEIPIEKLLGHTVPLMTD